MPSFSQEDAVTKEAVSFAGTECLKSECDAREAQKKAKPSGWTVRQKQYASSQF